MQILTSSPAPESNQAFVPLTQPVGSGEASVRILFVKHHQNYCQAKSLVFGGANFHLLTMETEAEVEKFLAAEEVDVILVDCRKDKDGGFDFVEKLRRAQPSVRVVLVADHFDLNSVVRGIRLGLKDVHTPPLDFGAVLANLIEFTALSRERRSTFSAGITSHLVDFLQGREVKTPERVPEAATDSGAAGAASGKKVVLKTKFTSLVAEQAKTRGLTGQLAKELEALEVRKVELDRRETALKSRESSAAGRDTWPGQLQGTEGRDIAKQQDELKKVEKAVAQKQEQLARQEADLDGRLAALKNDEVRLIAARTALEAEQTKAAAREQERLAQQAGPTKDQAAAAEREKLAVELKAMAKQQDELKKVEKAVAQKQEQLARQEAALDGRLAALKDEEARVIAARTALEAEQTKAAAREQERLAQQAGPTKDQSVAAEREKLAAELKAMERQKQTWAEELSALRESLAAEQAGRADEARNRAQESQTALQETRKLAEELEALREALTVERSSHAAEQEKVAQLELLQQRDPVPAPAPVAELPSGVAFAEHEVVREERDRLQREAEERETELHSLRERLAAAPIDDGLEDRRAALAQAEALLKAEVARIAAMERSTNEAAARLAAEQADFAKLVAERTEAFQARKAALRQQEAKIQAAAHMASMVPARPQPGVGGKGEGDQLEVAKARALYASKLLELEKVEADMAVERQRLVKEGRLVAKTGPSGKAAPIAMAEGAPVPAEPSRRGFLRGLSKGVTKGPPLSPPTPAR